MNEPHVFSHDAMKTTFTLRIHGEHQGESAGVAKECFEHLDYLEGKLSRYVEGSDIWQINNMAKGETLFLSEPCYDCLRVATKVYQETNGLFDITIGKRIEHLKEKLGGDLPELTGQLAIDPDRPAIHCLEAGREIDLGGIGKGFALDIMKTLMEDWEVQSALLSAGASTQLAFGEHRWPIELTGDANSHGIEIQNQALSASGTGIQGAHIILPSGVIHENPFKRLWVIHQSAALADAWSTALMLVDPGGFTAFNADDWCCYAEHFDGRILPLVDQSTSSLDDRKHRH